jgi:hypothetical protein
MTRHLRPRLAAAALTAGLALTAPAAEAAAWLGDCNDYATVSLVAEPWEANTRTFYNGEVRVAVVDTNGEPVCCSSWLVVVYPDKQDELGGRACMMLGSDEGLGFTGVDVKAIRSTYAADKGLTLTVPVRRMNADGASTRAETVTLVLDVGAGKLAVRP